MTSLRPRHFVKWLLKRLKTRTLGSGHSEAVLHVLWAKHAPNSENESSEDREVDNHLEKYIYVFGRLGGPYREKL